MQKKCFYGRGRTWVNIAARPCLHSFLTHNKHFLFENKVWEIYMKKCIHSLFKSSLSFDYVTVYICICVVNYTTLVAKSETYVTNPCQTNCIFASLVDFYTKNMIITSSHLVVLSARVSPTLCHPPPYRLSLPAGPQDYTLNPHRAAECRFELVALLLLGHMKEPIRVHHWWTLHYFPSSVQYVWFV